MQKLLILILFLLGANSVKADYLIESKVDEMDRPIMGIDYAMKG